MLYEKLKKKILFENFYFVIDIAHGLTPPFIGFLPAQAFAILCQQIGRREKERKIRSCIMPVYRIGYFLFTEKKKIDTVHTSKHTR